MRRHDWMGTGGACRAHAYAHPETFARRPEEVARFLQPDAVRVSMCGRVRTTNKSLSTETTARRCGSCDRQLRAEERRKTRRAIEAMTSARPRRAGDAVSTCHAVAAEHLARAEGADYFRGALERAAAAVAIECAERIARAERDAAPREPLRLVHSARAAC